MMSYTILKNAGVTPSEIHTKKELANLREMIENEPDEGRKDRLIKKMNALAINDAVRTEKLRRD